MNTSPEGPSPAIMAAGVVVLCNNFVLLLKRGPTDSGPGFWENPGGTIRPGEHPHEAALRELLEETGIKYTGSLHQIRHADTEYFHFKKSGANHHVHYIMYVAHIAGQTPPLTITLSEHWGWQWVPLTDAFAYPMNDHTYNALLNATNNLHN